MHIDRLGRAALTLTALVAGCTHSGEHATAPSVPVAPAEQAQQTFPTPDAASAALVDASRSDDTVALARILGPGGPELVSSGDPVADRNNRSWFVQAYDQHYDLAPNGDGSETLELGDSRWPMPIPLVKTNDGAWRFDTTAGHDEILNRRIGKNELAAIQVCRAIVDAQQEYAMTDPDHDGIPAYAERFASHPGKKDGLYWPAAANEPRSPLGQLFATAADDGYGSTTQSAIGPRRPYHGYFYRMLKSQGPGAPDGARDYRVDGHLIGGFAAVAWPAKYGDSGVMTFIVNQDGVIYQRNFGDNTDSIARAMSEYDPNGWTEVK